MKEGSQKYILLKILKDHYPEVVPMYSLRQTATDMGFIGTSADVRLRELEREGSIIKSFDEKRRVQYRAKTNLSIVEELAEKKEKKNTGGQTNLFQFCL